MLNAFQTPAEMEATLGANLKAMRLDRNLTQETCAERAGISLRALKNLEGGTGTTLRTLMRVLKMLGRENWIEAVAPIPTINPLTMTQGAQPRRRASQRRSVRPAQSATNKAP